MTTSTHTPASPPTLTPANTNSSSQTPALPPTANSYSQTTLTLATTNSSSQTPALPSTNNSSSQIPVLPLISPPPASPSAPSPTPASPPSMTSPQIKNKEQVKKKKVTCEHCNKILYKTNTKTITDDATILPPHLRSFHFPVCVLTVYLSYTLEIFIYSSNTFCNVNYFKISLLNVTISSS